MATAMNGRMSYKQAQVIVWVIGAVAEIEGREAACRLYYTIQQKLIGTDDQHRSCEKEFYEFIDHVLEEQAETARTDQEST